jgi:hypothetical protein
MQECTLAGPCYQFGSSPFYSTVDSMDNPSIPADFNVVTRNSADDCNSLLEMRAGNRI